MNLFEEILYFFMFKMEAPTLLGTFHIIGFIVFLAIGIPLAAWLIKSDDKKFRISLLIIWAVLLLGEIYRELVFSFNVVDGVGAWGYAWYQFPFQICSAPLYALPLIAFLKPGRARDALMAYSGTFALFAGVAVMFYPTTVFCSYTLINYQSLIHHGLQAITGAAMIARMRNRLSYKTLLSSYIVFGIVLCIAMTINLAGQNILRAAEVSGDLNMFFISPYHSCDLPILSLIRSGAPYAVFLMAYIFGFCALAALIYYLQVFIIKKVKGKKKQSEE